MAESPKVSAQALLVYKSIIDQFDIIKKQMWATTNYVVLIYAAIVWIDQHVEASPTFSWVLVDCDDWRWSDLNRSVDLVSNRFGQVARASKARQQETFFGNSNWSPGQYRNGGTIFFSPQNPT
jgi:hypothetical protein